MAKNTLIKYILSIVLFSTCSVLHGQILLTASLNSPEDAGILSESCGGPYELIIRRGADNTDTTFVVISDFGDALSGIDYNFPPGSFPFQLLPTEFEVVIPINVVSDALIEGKEDLFWEIAFLAGVESGTITLETAIVDDYSVEIHSATDTIIWCRDIPYVLLASSDAEIHWSPASFFDDSLGTAATVRPFDSGWYYAEVGSDACGAKDSVYFDLAIVEIEDDTVFICVDGPGAVLNGNLEGLATDFKWIPADTTLSDLDILNPIATPTVTTTYTLQSDIGVCKASDRVVVRIDSIPHDLHIDIAPLKPYYCAGEIVALFSPSFDTLDFPDITFQWLPGNAGIVSDLTLLNAAVQLLDTTTFFRQNFNNACYSFDSILVNVVPPSVPLSVNDTMLCPGEMFTVVVLSNQVTDPEWTPSEGLSCTKCLSPNVTVIGTPGSTLFYQFSGKILECPVGANLTIRIPPLQEIIIGGDHVVCDGEVIPLTILNPEGLTDLHWNVDFGDASLSCDNCPDPVVTIHSISAANTISISLTANTDSSAFCGAIGFFQLTPGATLQVTGPSFQACLGDTVTISTGNDSIFNVQWNVLTGDLSLSCNNCNFPVVTVNSLFNSLRFNGEIDSEEFCNVFGTLTVNTFPEDVSNLLLQPDPNVAPIGQGSNVTAILNASPGPSTIMWTVNGASISGTGSSIEFNASEVVNTLEAKFINSKGCEQIDTISFTTVPPSYQIPNAFTPDNGDELNDHFRIIINGNIVIEEFLIFNRWGQLVYEAADDDLEGWDGKFKQVPAASDTYVYTARLKYPDGRSEIAKGDVALLR